MFFFLFFQERLELTKLHWYFNYTGRKANIRTLKISLSVVGKEIPQYKFHECFDCECDVFKGFSQALVWP